MMNKVGSVREIQFMRKPNGEPYAYIMGPRIRIRVVSEASFKTCSPNKSKERRGIFVV